MSFTPNRSFSREFARDVQFRRFLKQTADDGARAAQQVAKSDAYNTGKYHDSIHGEVVTDERGEVVGRVVADDWKALILELHGTNTGAGPVAALRKGVESLGVRVRSTR